MLNETFCDFQTPCILELYFLWPIYRVEQQKCLGTKILIKELCSTLLHFQDAFVFDKTLQFFRFENDHTSISPYEVNYKREKLLRSGRKRRTGISTTTKWRQQFVKFWPEFPRGNKAARKSPQIHSGTFQKNNLRFFLNFSLFSRFMPLFRCICSKYVTEWIRVIQQFWRPNYGKIARNFLFQRKKNLGLSVSII